MWDRIKRWLGSTRPLPEEEDIMKKFLIVGLGNIGTE